MSIKELTIEAASALAKFFIDTDEWQKYLITVTFEGRSNGEQYRIRDLKLKVHKIDAGQVRHRDSTQTQKDS